MIRSYKEGFNWCSFNIEDILLSELLKDIQKPLSLYPGRTDSGLVVFTDDNVITWQLATSQESAKWSEDINLIHDKLYIIHFPTDIILNLTDDMNFIPLYKPLTLNSNLQWIGYYGPDDLDIESAFIDIEKADGLTIYSQDESSTWQLSSTTVFGNSISKWSTNFKLQHGNGYIIKLPQNYILPKLHQFFIEDLNSIVKRTYTSTVRTDIDPMQPNRTFIETMNHTSHSEKHPTDRFIIDNQVKPILYLGKNVYKFNMNNVSNEDGNIYPFLFLKTIGDESSILYNRIYSSNKTFVYGTYYLDLRNYNFDNDLNKIFYSVLGMPPPLHIVYIDE